MLKYAQIYQIVGSKRERYIGSTTWIYLCQRMAEHKYCYQQKRGGYRKINGRLSSKVLYDETARIELVQKFPSETKQKLLERELFYSSNMKDVVNVKRAIRV
jgi:hypothetical protein